MFRSGISVSFRYFGFVSVSLGTANDSICSNKSNKYGIYTIINYGKYHNQPFCSFRYTDDASFVFGRAVAQW